MEWKLQPGALVQSIKLQLIEMLTFPRLMALEKMELEECPHNGQFRSRNSECQTCVFMYECSWLQSNEPFVVLGQRSLAELATSLEFAIDYVDSQNHRAGGKRRLCVCEKCSWIDRARRLRRKVDGKTTIVRTP